MSDQNTVDLIRDLENTGKRVREMYPDPMAAPDALRHLFNTLVPRAITALRYSGGAKCQHTGCDAYAFKCLCHPHFVEVLKSYASRHPSDDIREQMEAFARENNRESVEKWMRVANDAWAQRDEALRPIRNQFNEILHLCQSAAGRAEAAAERAEKAAERRKR